MGKERLSVRVDKSINMLGKLQYRNISLIQKQ